MSDRLTDILGRVPDQKPDDKAPDPKPGDPPPAKGPDGKPLKPILAHGAQWNEMEATLKKKS